MTKITLNSGQNLGSLYVCVVMLHASTVMDSPMARGADPFTLAALLESAAAANTTSTSTEVMRNSMARPCSQSQVSTGSRDQMPCSHWSPGQQTAQSSAPCSPAQQLLEILLLEHPVSTCVYLRHPVKQCSPLTLSAGTSPLSSAAPTTAPALWAATYTSPFTSPT